MAFRNQFGKCLQGGPGQKTGKLFIAGLVKNQVSGDRPQNQKQNHSQNAETYSAQKGLPMGDIFKALGMDQVIFVDKKDFPEMGKYRSDFQ
jgi:hypothetical protein